VFVKLGFSNFWIGVMRKIITSPYRVLNKAKDGQQTVNPPSHEFELTLHRVQIVFGMADERSRNEQSVHTM